MMTSPLTKLPKGFGEHLKNIHRESLQGNKKYLCKNRQGKYRVLSKGELANPKSKSINDGFTKFSFREISLIVNQFKETIPQDSKPAISKSLKRMSIQKLIYEDRRNLFIRLGLMIFDHVRNYYRGYGLRSTTAFSLNLAEEIYKKPVIKKTSSSPQSNRLSTPPKTPLKTTVNLKPGFTDSAPSSPYKPPDKMSTIKQRQEALKKTQQKNTFSPTKAAQPTPNKITPDECKKHYILNPSQCLDIYKNVLFKDLAEVGNHTNLSDTEKLNLQVAKFLEFRKQVLINKAEKEQKVFTSQFFIDVMFRGNQTVVSEVIKNYSFDKTTLKAVFKYLSINKNDLPDNEIFYSSLTQLVNVYDKEFVQKDTSTLPVNNPYVIAVYKLLLSKIVNCDSQILLFLERLIEKSEFDGTSFKELISVYHEREKETNAGSTYKAKEILIAKFNDSPSLQKQFFALNPTKDLILFMKSNKAKIEE
jgi:hypothetical protein